MQNRTDRTGEAKWDSQIRTSITEQAEQDSQNRTGIRQAEQDIKRVGRTG
jgi:hypothetical protein